MEGLDNGQKAIKLFKKRLDNHTQFKGVIKSLIHEDIRCILDNGCGMGEHDIPKVLIVLTY